MPTDSHPLASLITAYHEFNAALVDELSAVPSPIQFLSYVSSNRPFIVRQGADSWEAVRKWNSHYLRAVMNDEAVRVAVTPHGNADAVVEDEHGRLMFVEPHEILEPFNSFMDYIQGDSEPSHDGRNVKYAQPQNDSLRDEYSALFPDVPSHIAFASEALGKDCDAINFWLGNSRSTTSLHKDNYENIYVQVRGQKHFTLLPPVEMPCVNEAPLPFARYRPVGQTLEARPNEDREPIPVPTWDPDAPHVRSTAYSKYSRPLRVTLNEGDMMYLPAMWYHKVGQGNGEEGFACSVNYWYDMDFSGSFWSSNAFIRDVYNAQLKEVVYPELAVEKTETKPA